MSDAVQALCFLAGANSMLYGEQLLTAGNPEMERDRALQTLNLEVKIITTENTDDTEKPNSLFQAQGWFLFFRVIRVFRG